MVFCAKRSVKKKSSLRRAIFLPIFIMYFPLSFSFAYDFFRFVNDHITDSYYAYHAQLVVERALEIQSDSSLSKDVKNQKIDAMKFMAHAYNQKLKRRIPLNLQVIEELNVEGVGSHSNTPKRSPEI